MKLKVIMVCILFIMLSLLPFRWANAETELVFHVIAAQPFGYTDNNGNPTGLHYEIIQELSIRSNISIRPVIMPYNRIWATLSDGQHDGGIVWRSSERDALVDYLSFVWTDYITALTLKNHEIRNYGDLHDDIDVGVLTSSSINDQFNSDDKINKILTGKYENAISMLVAKRVDAVVGNLFAYLYIAKHQNALDELSLPGFYMGHREQWLQMSKKSRNLQGLAEHERRQLLNTLALTMTNMVEDGTIQALNKKYYGEVVDQVNDFFKQN